jgi:hypothetical protein
MLLVNLAQILWGTAEEYLSQIHLCQAKASWFYSLYSDLLVVFGELVMVFEERSKFLTIWSIWNWEEYKYTNTTYINIQSKEVYQLSVYK